MKLLTTIAEARAAVRALRLSPDTTIGLVPTMGALHEGHLSLMRAASSVCDHVAASIFVNPTQFGPNEDLTRYPRTLDADLALLEKENVDLVFAPSAAEMYPTGSLGASLDPGELGGRLDGRSRPGHFRGVCTVVAKLFNILGPDRAFFGQKDAAQVAVLRAMVRDLNLPVEITVCPTVRDADGLALSSRNRYLTPAQRHEALALSHALGCAERAIALGEQDAVALIARIRDHLNSPSIGIDYVEAVDADTLLPSTRIQPNTLLAVAAWVGKEPAKTRLIDNVLVTPPLTASPA